MPAESELMELGAARDAAECSGVHVYVGGMKEPPPWSLSVLLLCPLKFPLDRLYPHNHHGSVAPDDLR